MKIDKVFHLEVPDDKDPSKKKLVLNIETKKVTDLLETNPIFEKEIIRIREKWKIPLTGFPLPTKENSTRLDRDYIDLVESDCEEAATRLGLPIYWSHGIQTFAVYNVFIATVRKPVRVMFDDSSGEDGENTIIFYLTFSEMISKTEFLKEMENQWDYISDYIENLPKPQKNLMLRADWAKRIIELRDTTPKTPFWKVADALQNELREKNVDVIISEDYAKILYLRWKSKLKGNNKKK